MTSPAAAAAAAAAEFGEYGSAARWLVLLEKQKSSGPVVLKPTNCVRFGSISPEVFQDGKKQESKKKNLSFNLNPSTLIHSSAFS